MPNTSIGELHFTPGKNRRVSFLDNLENNLKALENREQAMDTGRARDIDRAQALAAAPWAERLKREPFAQELMRQSTIAGRERRMKVNLAWIDTALRLEARGQRLELRPTPDGIVAVFLWSDADPTQETIDLAENPRRLVAAWMHALDERRRIEEAQPAVAEID